MFESYVPSRLFWFWLSMTFTVILAVSSFYMSSAAWAVGMVGVAIVSMSAAIANIVRWTWENVDQHYLARKEANAVTSEIMHVRELKGLSVEAIHYLDHRQQALVLVNGEDGDEIYLRTEYGMVPLEFVRKYFDYPDPISLRPIGYYPEGKKYEDGTELREYARILTQHAVSMDWAISASGNQAARWIPGQRIIALNRMRVIQTEGEV